MAVRGGAAQRSPWEAAASPSELCGGGTGAEAPLRFDQRPVGNAAFPEPFPETRGD